MVRWTGDVPRNQPILIAAFTGWNDAGNAASNALDWLTQRWETSPVATLDPEPFYNFAEARPRLRLESDGSRSLIWPDNDLTVTTISGADTASDQDTQLVILVGSEPHLRWRTFASQIVAIAQKIESPMVITLGALLADVPHTRATTVYGTSDDPSVAERLGLSPSGYEGPTGIVGVLHNACANAGLRTASLWAAVPGYASEIPSPKATLALIQRLTELLDITLETTELQVQAGEYEQHISELAEQTDGIAHHIAELEQAYDEQFDQLPNDPAALLTQIEQYLREQTN